MSGDNKFSYTYTTPTEKEKREIEQIRSIYAQKTKKESDKLTRLRRLDARVKNSAICISLILGVVGTLIFGAGMSIVLVWKRFIGGIILSALGVIPIALANPGYNAVFRYNKKKYGKEILQLSEELLNEKKH